MAICRKPSKNGDSLTWAEIKRQIEKAGVKDTDYIYLVDLGPNAIEIHVAKEGCMVQIVDDPILLAGDDF